MQKGWQSDRRLYLDATGNVVESSDPNKASLLVHKGGTIPMEQARRLGLVKDEQPGELGRTGVSNVERHVAKMSTADTAIEEGNELESMPGINSELAEALTNAGIDSLEKLDKASDDDLLAISGIGPAKLKAIREHRSKE